MYQRRPNSKPILITVCVMAAVAAGLLAVNIMGKRAKAPVETEPEKHSILIYKSTDGSIEYDRKLFTREDDEELVLSAKPQEMVALLIRPAEDKVFEDVSINATDDISDSYSYLVNDVEGDVRRINFVMPEEDILVNLKFADKEKKEEPQLPEEMTEADGPETPETNPYNLVIHGLTASVLQSYSGQFDDRQFLQELGDQLHITSAMSEYQGVTDVTFSEEELDGTHDPDQVCHYIYFNNDPRWEALAVYYKKDKRYLFTEAERESETSENETSGSQTDTSGSEAPYQDVSYQDGSGSYSQNAGNGSQATSGEVTTSFDILKVSTVFLKYVGGKDRFYNQTFDYVQKNGKSGEIVSTMRSYKIDPDKNRAEFTLDLNTGETIHGTYDKAAGTFAFSGL